MPDERKIVPITLNRGERLLLRQLSSDSGLSMCAVVRTLLYKEFSTRQLSKPRKVNGPGAR